MAKLPNIGKSERIERSTRGEPGAGPPGLERLSDGERAPAAPEHVIRRRRIGLAAGLVLAALMYVVLPDTLAHGGKVTAATAVLMGVWWMTEALPIPATALVPLIAFPLFSGTPINDVGASYGNNIIFLFMGGFMLALAIQRWNLHRRMALLTLKMMGPKPAAMIGGFMIATGFISMWVSNTATAVMMLPIGMSVLLLVARVTPEVGATAVDERGGAIVKSNFSTALMLGIAYAASVGSLGTIIGTPPNALLVGYLQENFDITIGFGQWMLVGVPLSIVFMFFTWLLLTKILFRPEIEEIPGGRELVARELEALGGPSRGEVRVLLVFLLAAALWVFLPLGFEKPPMTDAGVAVSIAVLLFIIPGGAARGVRLLDWQSAAQLPWGVLLLFGGGLALSAEFGRSGLTAWIGEGAQGLHALPKVISVVAITTVIIFLTELTSNTATAATFLPVAGGVALGIGADPMLLTIPVALSATCAFMLPVATPPNAVAFGTGHVSIGQMVKGGFFLNLIGIVLVTLATMTLAVWVFRIAF